MGILKAGVSHLPQFIEILTGAGLFFLPISKGAAESFFITALGFWILHKIVTRTALFPDPKTVIPYALFLGITFLSLTQAAPFLFPEGLRGALKWLKYLAVFFMCRDIFSAPEKRTRLFWVFLASMLIVSLDGFYQLYSGIDLLRGQTLDPGRIVRMKACLGAPNLLASFLMFALPLCALFFHRGHARIKTLCGIAFLIFLAAFFLTYSRGAFYAMLISLFFNLILMKKIRIALAALACLALLVLTVPSLRYNFVKTLEKKDITILERRDYWEVASGMIKRHPLLGVGVNTYHAKFPAYATDPAVRQAYPHNSYLQMASEIGIPGLLVFFLILGWSLARSLRPDPEQNGPVVAALRIALTAFLIQAFADTSFYALQTAYLFWVFWGIFDSRDATHRPDLKTGLS